MDWIIIFVKVCTFRAPLNLAWINLQCPFWAHAFVFSLSSLRNSACHQMLPWNNAIEVIVSQNNEGAHRRHQHGHVLSKRPEQFNVNRRQHTVTAGYKYQQSLSPTWWSERNERVLLDKIIAFLNCIFKMGYLKWKVIVFISNILFI